MKTFPTSKQQQKRFAISLLLEQEEVVGATSGSSEFHRARKNEPDMVTPSEMLKTFPTELLPSINGTKKVGVRGRRMEFLVKVIFMITKACRRISGKWVNR